LKKTTNGISVYREKTSALRAQPTALAGQRRSAATPAAPETAMTAIVRRTPRG